MTSCATCLLPAPICAIASKVTNGRCELRRESQWEHRAITGYVVTLDAATTWWTAEHEVKPGYAFAWALAALREADVTWTMRLPEFLKRYRPSPQWAAAVKIEIPEIPKEYRR
jgi:hypothetical protein